MLSLGQGHDDHFNTAVRPSVRQRSSPLEKAPDADPKDSAQGSPPEIARANKKFVIIPYDYRKQRVVPILIRKMDGDGHRVYQCWIEAVIPIAQKLRHMARHILGDEAMVSEITEASVHGLSARYGEEKSNKSPSGLIYEDARWLARDMVVGGWRARKGYDTRLTWAILDTLIDPRDFPTIYEHRDFIEKLVERLNILGLPDVAAQVHLYLSESEQAAMFDAPSSSQAWNTNSHRFFYWLRKTVKGLEPRDKGR